MANEIRGLVNSDGTEFDDARELELFIPTSGTITISGGLTTTGNISGNLIFGDGSNLTNIPLGSGGITTTEVAVISSNLQGQITNNDTDISDLRTDVDTISGDLDTLETQFANLDATYATDSDLVAVSGNLQGQITNNDTDISDIQTDIANITGGLSQLDTRYVEVTGDTMTGDFTLNANAIVNGNITISGNIVQISGSNTTEIAQTLTVEDNLIVINKGETGAGVLAGQSGLQVDRGTLDNYFLVLDENIDNGTFAIGTSGNLQPVATREETPTDQGLAYWNSSQSRFDTSSTLISEIGSNTTLINTISADLDTLESQTTGITGGLSQLDTRYVEVTGDTMTGTLFVPEIGSHDNYVNEIHTSEIHLEPISGGNVPAYEEGMLFYNGEKRTLNLYNDIEDVALDLGEENWIRIVNKTGSQINNGQVVYINGAQGNRPTVALADNADELTADDVIGLATHNITNNQEGFITTFGVVREINTSTWTTGDQLFLDSSGGLTNIEPETPLHRVRIGYALNSTNDGQVLVVVQSSGEIKDLHDVLITTPQQDEILAYSDAISGWTNTTVLSAVSGAIDSRYVNIDGDTMTGDLIINGSISPSEYKGLGNPKTLVTTTSTVSQRNGTIIIDTTLGQVDLTIPNADPEHEGDILRIVKFGPNEATVQTISGQEMGDQTIQTFTATAESKGFSILDDVTGYVIVQNSRFNGVDKTGDTMSGELEITPVSGSGLSLTNLSNIADNFLTVDDTGEVVDSGMNTSIISGLTGMLQDDIDDNATNIATNVVNISANALTISTNSGNITSLQNTVTLDADISLAGKSWFLDETDLVSNDPNKVASQQSIKQYVDASSAGVAPKEAVHVATTTYLDNISGGDTWVVAGSGVGKTLTNGISGSVYVDSHGLDQGDRVLVKDEDGSSTNLTNVDNGIYEVTTNGSPSQVAVLTRTTDFDGDPSGEVKGGTYTFVIEGALLNKSGWMVLADGNVTVDVDAIQFVQFQGLPTNHGSTHTDGSDDIQDATNSQKGLATAAQITTLEFLDANSALDSDVVALSASTLASISALQTNTLNITGGLSQLDDLYVNITGDTMTGSLTISGGGDLTVSNLNLGDAILTTDTSGKVQESGVTVESAPTGGSGISFVEYLSTPTSPPNGMLWVESKDANTKTINFSDGVDIYAVDLYKK